MVRPSDDNINEEELNLKNENWQDKTDVLAENSAPCHFVYPTSHGGWPGIEPGLCGENPATDHVSHDTAILWSSFF